MHAILGPSVAPHMVLGIPSHSSHDEAIRAFALRSRKVKSDATAPFSMADLTSALAEIEQGSRAGSVTLRYAIPCNPETYLPTSTFVHGGSKLEVGSPIDDLIGLMPSPDQVERAALTLLNAAISRLLDWNWDDSQLLARECLRVSKDEDTRDEALNVLAASLTLQGEPNKAMQALNKAIEGKWNLPLQVNLAVIAVKEDPAVASSQMSFIIDGASTADEKLRAARLAIRLWRESQGDDLDDDDRDPLPPQLLTSFFGLLAAADLSEEDFYEFGTFLARMDSSETSFANALNNSPFSSSLSAKVVRARRVGFIEFLDALVESSARDTKKERPWIQEEVDGLVESINSRLSDETEDASIPTSMAFRLLEHGLDCSNIQRVALRFLLELHLTEMIDDDSCPSNKFAKWHSEARMAITRIDLNADQLSTLKSLDQNAGNLLGALTHRFNLNLGTQLERAANGLADSLRGFLKRMSADKEAARQLQEKIIGATSEAIQSYDSVIPLVSDASLKRQMTDINVALRNLQNRVFDIL